MENPTYGQFCPVAMAAEILCRRWTMVLLRELVAGSTRFNDLRRGVSRMSPALLSKRLKELQAAGVVERVATGDGGAEYRLTPAGHDLRDVVEAMGIWGQRWVQAQPSLRNLDAGLLMWDMRRNLDPGPLGEARRVIQFLYPELPETRRYWWLLVERGGTDLCSVDPGCEVDLYVVTDLRTMTAVWMGLADLDEVIASGRMKVTGEPRLAAGMRSWLGLSPFAQEAKLVRG